MSARDLTPQRLIKALDYLKDHGFTDDLFSRIHHKEWETIRNMRRYCESRGSFKAGSSNVAVCIRAMLVMESHREFREEGSGAVTSQVFQRFVEEAVAAFPI